MGRDTDDTSKLPTLEELRQLYQTIRHRMDNPGGLPRSAPIEAEAGRKRAAEELSQSEIHNRGLSLALANEQAQRLSKMRADAGQSVAGQEANARIRARMYDSPVFRKTMPPEAIAAEEQARDFHNRMLEYYQARMPGSEMAPKPGARMQVYNPDYDEIEEHYRMRDEGDLI